MNEKLEQNEYSQDFPIDSKFFDRFDDFSPENVDEEKIKVFNNSVKEGKIKAFDYAEKTLDYLLQSSAKIQKIDKQKKWDPESAPYHDLANLLQLISTSLQVLDIRPDWLSNPQKAIKKIEPVVLEYALHRAMNYKKAVQEDHLEPEEVLKKLALANVIKQDYIETKILKKINELPESIKENLFEINHDI
ncbi:MAG: hypothetical protein QMD50_00010 [Patescibacteria group bacterium]|nr:hypothetical protein [Patescibacteria group bacterium]